MLACWVAGPHQGREGQRGWVARGPGDALDGAVAHERARDGVRGMPHEAQQTRARSLVTPACRPGNSLIACHDCDCR